MVKSPTVADKEDVLALRIEKAIKTRIQEAAKSEGLSASAFMRRLFLMWEKQNATEREQGK
jgi:uncharacterized protein (DUF1778 family)